MSKIITEEQMREIGSLSVDHWDALIAYGADMYRSGLVKGAIVGIIGSAAGVTMSILVRNFKKKNKVPSKENGV